MYASCLSSRDNCASAGKNPPAWEFALEEEASSSGGLEQGPHLQGTHLQGESPHHQPAVLAVLDKAILWQTLVLDGNNGRACAWDGQLQPPGDPTCGNLRYPGPFCVFNCVCAVG